MELRDKKLRDGLQKLYYAQIIAIVSLLSTILVMIPVLGLLIVVVVMVATIVGLVLTIMGLVKLGDVHPNYTIALILSIISGVMGLLNKTTVISVLGIILDLVVIWLLVKTTNCFLGRIERTDVMQKGNRALVCNIAAVLISILCTLLSLFMVELSILLLVVALIVSLVGLVFYVVYLKQASEAF